MRMPMTDSLLALVGAFLGVIAVILLRGNADPAVWAPFLVVAAALGLFAVWQARSAPAVLVVGSRDSTTAAGIEGALAYDGLTVRRCSGPTGRRCPVYDGKPCPYGDHLRAAVVEGAHAGGTAPPCDRGLDAPVLYFLDDAAPLTVAADVERLV